jgi:crotonobetainyl-CoA:carnitine CoA-transferase CaiB-like acyl-CoA transferase
LGAPELIEDPRFHTGEARRQNYAEVISVLDRVFANKTRDEWMNIFARYDFSYSPVYDYADAVKDPQILENEYVTEMDHAVLGKMKTIGFPVQFSETPASIRNSAPEFGQHTEEVIREIFGYSWDEIADLRDKGAFG